MMLVFILLGGLAVAGYMRALQTNDFHWQVILKPIPVLCMLIGLWQLSITLSVWRGTS